MGEVKLTHPCHTGKPLRVRPLENVTCDRVLIGLLIKNILDVYMCLFFEFAMSHVPDPSKATLLGVLGGAGVWQRWRNILKDAYEEFIS